MAWARFDDRFHGNPKVLGVWHTCPEAIGLYVMSVTYCSQQETDGEVPDWFIQTLVAGKAQRNRLTGALENAGLFEPTSAGFCIRDYLEYNPSKAQLKAKRDAQKQRRLRQKTVERANSVPARTQHADAAVIAPVPTRPDPSRIKEGQTNLEGSPLGAGGSPHLRVVDNRTDQADEVGV